MQQKETLRRLYSPYADNGAHTISEWIDAHKCDPSKTMEVDGVVFYKIICRCELYSGKRYALLVFIETQENIHLNDILIDEDDREFIVNSFEMIHLSKDVFDEHPNLAPISITGKSYDIGNYLSLKKDTI